MYTITPINGPRRKVAELVVFFIYITPYKNNSTRKNMSRNPPTPGIPGAPKLAQHPSPVDPMGVLGWPSWWKFKQPKKPKFPVISWKSTTFRSGSTSVTWVENSETNVVGGEVFCETLGV